MAKMFKHSEDANVQELAIFTTPPTVTCCYYSSISVTNEIHLASRESKDCLISGGDSSYSWVFIHALDLSGGRS